MQRMHIHSTAVFFVAALAAWLIITRDTFSRTVDDKVHEQKPEVSIAIVRALQVVSKLDDMDRYKQPRDTEFARIETEYNAKAAAVEAEYVKAKEMDKNSPDYAAAWARYEKHAADLVSIREKLMKEYESFCMKQRRELWGIVVEAASRIAEVKGFKYLIASGALDPSKITTESYNAQGIQFALSPVLSFPEGADITADVLDDLHIE